jgi:hypothetical protein
VREDALYNAALGYLRQLLETSGIDVPALTRQLVRDNAGADPVVVLEEQMETLRRNIDQVYTDKLAGVIQEDFFTRKYQEFTRREEELLRQLGEARQREKKTPKNQLTALKMGDIIQALSNKSVTKTALRLAFDQILVYEPNELRPEDAQCLGLTEETAKQLQTRGGILFLENAVP